MPRLIRHRPAPRRSSPRSWALLMVSLVLVVAAGCRRAPPPVPAPPGLAEIAPGRGTPYTPRTLLQIRDRALVLPSGERCPATGACPGLMALRGQPIAVDLEASLMVAEMSVPLAQIALILGVEETICLRVAAAGASRCLDVLPQPAAALGGWMDAEKPLAKIRLMVRADGMEVVTVRGKIPGPDRFGPSVPTKGGKHDLALLAQSLARLAAHLPQEREAALLASPQTSAQTVAAALDALANASEDQFEKRLFFL